jgi:two-component system phosphate regulon sensor histidine kinase PhoR
MLLLIRRRIAIKLTLTLVGFVAISVLAAGLYLNRALHGLAVDALEGRLAIAARLLVGDGRALQPGAAAAEIRAFAVTAARATAARVAVVDASGRLLADSGLTAEEVGRVPPQADRPEIRAALGGRAGRDVRADTPGASPVLHVAVPVDETGRIAGAVRLTLPLAAVTAAHRDVTRVMLAGGVVALVVALGIGLFVAGRVTRPVVEMQAIARQMSEGRFDVRAPVRSVDEIGALGRALNVMTARLREKLHDVEQEQAKVRAILDTMAEGVIAVDGQGSVLLMNGQARAMFGIPAARERRPFQEVIRNADIHEIVRESRAAGDGVRRRQFRLSHPVERLLEASAAPLRLDRDETGVVMVLHDVTALRRLEQVRTEFVANVSHELRTPLTAIQGYLETLLGGGLEDPVHSRKFLEIAFRHTERLGRLLDDLTDLSNIELGKVTLHLGPTALEDVVDSVLAIIQPRAETGGVALTSEVPAGLPEVQADHDRLAQILINLVDNAVKYTPSGGRVSVRARLVEGAVEIAVIDTGIGIPRADLPRITERFYRVDKARSRALGGTGLGLAIVKHLVAAHGGTLAIESEVDEGTAVRFTLPLGTTASQLPLPLGGGVPDASAGRGTEDRRARD